jgi:hypothetical protein
MLVKGSAASMAAMRTIVRMKTSWAGEASTRSNILEPLAYANLTDVAGVQPTGSMESRAALGGFIIVTSAFRFSMRTATVNYR